MAIPTEELEKYKDIVCNLNDELQESVDIINDLCPTTKMDVKNNNNVYITINNFNCTNKEYLNND